MRRACAIGLFMFLAMSGSGVSHRASAQEIARNSLLEPVKRIDRGSLEIALRLDEQTPFLGAATVHVLPDAGVELLGLADKTAGTVLFYAVDPGRYDVIVDAPGFSGIRVATQVEGGGQRTLAVVLKRKGARSEESTASSATSATVATTMPNSNTAATARADAAVAMPSADTVASPADSPAATMDIPASATAPAPETTHEKFPEPSKASVKNWRPAEWNDEGESLDRNVSCPVNQLLVGTGERVKEFVASMEKFTATERVEHFAVDKDGERRKEELRKFEYVAILGHDQTGGFWFEEYRNGSTDTQQFPANIATMGLPAIVLVFHPDFQDDFEFGCDGLVHEEPRDLWQLHWKQREDRPVRIESYVVNGSSFQVHLQGRAWIDAGKGQVVRLESNLARPIPEIELWEQHQKIEYTGIRFASTGEEIWLPKSAEVYVERRGKRYYRKHSFDDFRLFNVDLAQNVKAPSKGSYSFTNLTDRDMTGELIVTPVEGRKGGPITLRFAVPAHHTVVKIVGPGKDVGFPPADIRSAKFVHSGDAGSVKVDVDLVKETTLDVVPAGAQENP